MPRIRLHRRTSTEQLARRAAQFDVDGTVRHTSRSASFDPRAARTYGSGFGPLA